MRRLLLAFAVGMFVAWGFTHQKWTLELTPIAFHPAVEPAPPQPVQVHPEVLNLQESFSRVAEAVKPAVVSISTIHIEKYQAQENPFEFFFWNPDDMFQQFFNGPDQQPRRQRKPPPPQSFQRKIAGMGSGVIIDPDGYILTNEHVVRDADEIKVSLADNPDKQIPGKVIGRDERTDLAVVKIKVPRKLPYARLGDSDALKVGDWAIAIGSPFGLAQTVTVGVISATRQNLPIEGRAYKDLLQTDAAINPGNSGGPLVNIHGEVIGVNTAIYTPSGGFAGIGFAIPINRAKEIIPQLRAKGKVVRGWIGVILEDRIDDATAKVFGIPDAEGSLVKEVLPDYPAAKAGLKRGDVIREFDGKKVKNNYDLQTLVARANPGETVPLKIIRNKKEMQLKIKIGEAPESLESIEKKAEGQPQGKENEAGYKWMGVTVQDLTPELRDQFEIPQSENGVIVAAVDDNSKLAEIGLMPGDLIRAVNQESTPDIKTFKEISKKVKLSSGVVFDLLRRGEPIYLSYMGPGR